MDSWMNLLSVPEHFSSPLLQLAAQDPSIELVSCPSGTGQIMSALKEDQIDLAIALTEALTAGIVHKKAEYKIVGTYVTSPLNWAVAVGKESKYQTLADLKGEKIGISRIGRSVWGNWSKSFFGGTRSDPEREDRLSINSFPRRCRICSGMALQQGWVDADGQVEPIQFEVLDTFKNLRDGVNSGQAAAFMWEHFTTKSYLSELRFISHVPTPWASWMIVASSKTLSSTTQKDHLSSFLQDLTKSVEDFDSESSRRDKSKEFVMKQFGYPEVDVVSWLEGVSYPKDGVDKVERNTLQLTLETLEQAGVLEPPADGQAWYLEDFVDTSVAQLV
ncbi:BQ2448_7778 [Microbotryum intermedium]|uniref:BQ2448_7778 protein n=1 Tax=Microbotryum intermedium TaxID=269621 RepID=A0A238FPQ5_9BASI|nr:BQ2448_7778 [Microbotryum intermedium]